MKKLIFAAVFILSAQFVMAQPNEKYLNAMKKNLEGMGEAFKNPASLLATANNFERIGETEKNQWLPYYYAALCQVNVGFMEQDKSKTDAIADKANELINKADVINPNSSEISCIRSMIASCHMMVDPMQRWEQYGQESSNHLAAAIRQDVTNPRPELLIGEGLRYTPEQFGGGCKTASVQLEAAMKKFETFKTSSPLDPNWGKERAMQLLSECK